MTLIPLGDGQQLHDRLKSLSHEVIELEPGKIPGKNFGYEIPPTVIPAGWYKRVKGNAANIWCNASGAGKDYAVQFNGPMGGGSDSTLWMEDFDLFSNAGEATLHLVNANSQTLIGVRTHHGRDGIRIENNGTAPNIEDGGYSEKNTLINCSAANVTRAALAFEKGTGNASFNGTIVHGFSGHVTKQAAYPLYVGLGADVYGSVLEGYSWTADHSGLCHGIKILGKIGGTRVKWSQEGGGLYLMYINGHHSRQAGSIELHAVWPYSIGIAVDVPANKTLDQVKPKRTLITGDLPGGNATHIIGA